MAQHEPWCLETGDETRECCGGALITEDSDDNDDETPRDPADDDSGYGPSSEFHRSMRKDDQ